VRTPIYCVCSERAPWLAIETHHPIGLEVTVDGLYTSQDDDCWSVIPESCKQATTEETHVSTSYGSEVFVTLGDKQTKIAHLGTYIQALSKALCGMARLKTKGGLVLFAELTIVPGLSNPDNCERSNDLTIGQQGRSFSGRHLRIHHL
jgi:hypothetical protein